ncbi:Topoisomerase I damage affected protein 11 [Candida viswanathii]|uniref:Topoisomerase I damage affected protein 11 n=1 Tax=Candida viswanathii TaxID=5486 RepID=A0A367XZE1_9ASCO|nr:Topoisomerase I damage affected protein 11 [Candida viswanathii]
MTTITANTPEVGGSTSNPKRNGTKSTTPHKPIEFKVRRSSSVHQHHATPSSTTLSASKPIRNSGSMSKGLNIFAVSPLPSTGTFTAPTDSPKAHLRNPSYTSQASLPDGAKYDLQRYNSNGPNDLRYDLPLPSADKLVAMDIDEQLRYLALKEMCVVEIKDHITTLNNKLNENQKELHQLREIIQRSLYKELSSGNSLTKASETRPRQNSNPRDEAIARTRRRRSSLFNENTKDAVTPLNTNTTTANMTTPATTNPESSSRLWSGLSKPLNLIQQFDTILQNEFEKSLLSEKDQQARQEQTRRLEKRMSHQSKSSEGSISSIGSVSSPLQSKSVNPKQLPKQYYNKQTKLDDMMQTVSSSIWSFVNDVKANVLSSLQEDERERSAGGNGSGPKQPRRMYNLDTGSTIDVLQNAIEDDSETELLEPLASDEEENVIESLDLSMYKR